MKKLVLLIGLVALPLVMFAQVAAPPATRSQGGLAASRPVEDLSPLLPQLQQAAQTINLDVARLRIEKWKADTSVKSQAQTDAESVTRNLTNAFPVILEQARARPQSLGAAFRLYRNLDALYDVFNGLAEATGSFGPKADYDLLSKDAANLAQLRHALGDKVEFLAAGTDSEVDRLRLAVQAAATTVAPTHIVVDDQEKPVKPARKKSAKKPAEAPPASSPSTSQD